MRPTGKITESIDTKSLSSHDKKIQKRVAKFMQIVDELAFSPEGKLTILKFLLDKTAVVLSDSKAANKFNDKFHHFTEELDLAVRKSKKEENQQEFIELLQDRLARDGLGKHYKEYSGIKSSGTSTAQLIEWISKKQKEVNPPKVKQRSHSQPAMFVSASTPTQAPPMTTAALVANLPSSAPVFSAPPTVNVPAMQPVINPAFQYPFVAPTPQQPGGYPQVSPAPAMAFQSPPTVSTSIGPTTVRAAFNAEGILDSAQQIARDTVLDKFDGANFNRKGTITLLKYLVNSELPAFSENPQAKRFNEKLMTFVVFYEKTRQSTVEQKRTRWAFECVVNIAQRQLKNDELVALLDKLVSEDSQSVVNWLNTLY